MAMESTIKETGESLVQMQQVTKRFGEATAVSDITLDVPKGAIMGMVYLVDLKF